MKKITPFVSIVTVNYNGKHLLKDFFDALYKINYPEHRFEIFMVDNGSKDTSLAYVKKNYPKVKIIKNKENNYCKANNMGISKSKGEYVAILNNDTKVDRDWLANLVKIISAHDDAAVVGGKALFMDGRIQSAGHVVFPMHYSGDRGLKEEDKGQYDAIEEVPSVSNSAALYRKKAFKDAGFFDEDFVMYIEDVDICFRLKQKGWKIFYTPEAVVCHKMHGSNQDKKERQFYIERNRLLFISKHFPEKLAESFFGHGGIMWLRPAYFQAILLDILNVLIKNYGSTRALDIFTKIKSDIKKIEDYKHHCESVNSDIKEKTVQLKDNESKLKSEEFARAISDKANLKRQAALLNEKARESISLRQNEINEASHKIRSLEEKLSAQVLQSQSKDTELKLKSEELARTLSCKANIEQQAAVLNERINNFIKEVLEKDYDIKAGFQKIDQLQDVNKELEQDMVIFKERERFLNSQIEALQKEIENRDKNVKFLNTIIENDERKIDDLLSRIKSKEEQAELLFKAITEREEDISRKNEVIKTADENIKQLKEDIRSLDNAVAEKNAEVSRIYNSETYRFIVKPVLWPMFFFIKQTATPFKALMNLGRHDKEKRGICIAQISGSSAEAMYLQENEYSIRLFNPEFKEESSKLIIDIWPNSNPSHPERHYCYFAKDILLKPRESLSLKFKYDWEKRLEIFVDGKSEKIQDFWRSGMSNTGLYRIDAYMLESGNMARNRLCILQKLVK